MLPGNSRWRDLGMGPLFALCRVFGASIESLTACLAEIVTRATAYASGWSWDDPQASPERSEPGPGPGSLLQAPAP